MDAFVSTHTSSTYEGSDGTMTMGYYLREDLPFYWALADNFTLCDSYFCSILGPTHPNRLMANSGTIDPAGTSGGPVTDTNPTPDVLWNCTWPTMQEVLQDAGVPWKVYHPSNADLSAPYLELGSQPTWDPALYNPTLNPEVMVATDHVLPYFTAFRNPLSPLYTNAFTPTFPNDFVADVASGALPSVSWIIPPLGFDDHPSSSPNQGQYFVSLVLNALTANKAVWSKTAVPHVRRERRLVRSRAAAHRPGRHVRRVPHRDAVQHARARLRLAGSWHRRPARPGHPGASAGDLAVQPGREDRYRRIRPHLAA